MSESIFFKRQSKRAYLDREIPEDSLQSLLEKIRWSPSCANNQPWKLIFVIEKTQHAKFGEALARGNEWALKAPVLIAVCAKKEDDYNREDDPVTYYQFDCGLLVMSLLPIPDEFHVMCVISLGYEGPVVNLDERTRKKDEAPRARKEISEIISTDKFDFKE